MKTKEEPKWVTEYNLYSPNKMLQIMKALSKKAGLRQTKAK